ncbi:MAG: DUF1311 domain-containing protein, partial [Desulfovibrio sp.]|nr:DUF1311 domain-containing protein [Desulfovibrio sp.]
AGGEPDWNACWNVTGWGNVRECQEKAIAWWDRRLNAAYQRQKKACPTAQCPKKLLDAERAWIRYRDLMEEAAGEVAGGYEAKQNAIVARAKARYLATKHQTLLLERMLDE